MQMNHRLWTYGYHLLAESMLLFLLMLPILRFIMGDGSVPYWTYLSIICIMTAVLTYLINKTLIYGTYIMLAPVWMFLFYLIGLPLVFSILCSVILTWRAIAIRSESELDREGLYLRVTIILTLLLAIFIHDIGVVIYGMLLCLILMIGYMMSHLFVIEYRERKQFQHRLWILVLGSFIFGAIIIVLAFDVVRYLLSQLWSIIQYVLLAIIEVLARIILPIFDVDLELPERELKLDGSVGGEFADLIEGITPSEVNLVPYMYGFLIVLGAGLLIFIFYRYFKRTFHSENRMEQDYDVQYIDLASNDNLDHKASFFTQLKERILKRPNHPARMLVYQFEKKYPRFAHETVEEWLQRLQLESTIPIYQKVRYGDQEITKAELEKLKQELETMDKKLKGELS